MKIFLICPVRNATEDQKTAMNDYITFMEDSGNEVYYPARDTNQVDNIGFRICNDNKLAIFNADEVHIFWDKDSKGSLFDLGIAFAFDKPLHIVNLENLEITETKSFTNMIKYWSDLG